MKEKEESVEESPKKRPYQGISFGRIFLGLLIVFIGGLYLARNAGWIDRDISIDIWNLWPILIIFFGLSLLTARGIWPIIAGIVITLLVMAIIGYAFIAPEDSRWINRVGTGAETQRISIAKEPGVNFNVVNIKTGAGTLHVTGGSGELVSGSLESSFLDITTRSEVRGGVQEVNITGRGSGRIIGRQVNNLDLQLNNDTPLDFSLDTGAMDMDLDLRDLILESLDINTGASSLDLQLGDKADKSTVSIDAGASSINVSLPKTAGVRLVVTSGLSSRDLPDFNRVSANTYESTNYDSVSKKIDIDMSLGVSSLGVEWR